MPGRWSDEWRDRGGRRDDWRDEEPRRSSGGEDRSFDREERVFGERDTGAGYNQPRGTNDPPRSYRGGGGWQDPDYGGVSPAMRRGDYDTGYRGNPRITSQDYTRGGRYYGDDARRPIYGREYGQGALDHGPAPRGPDEGSRFGSREADERWRREMGRGRPYSGGTGGYDYERGYGDGGREYGRDTFSRGDAYGRDRDDDHDFEDRARDAGDFFRRTGEKVKSWFSDMGHGSERDDRYDSYRGARGLGPKGYKRSDERIIEEVHQRLTDDSWLDASNIDVSVSGGEVTLSGTVESREAKHRAERMVEDLSGVVHVQNNLRIQSGNYFTSAGRGYGDSAGEAQMRRDDTVKDVTDGGDGEATRATTRRNS